MSTGSGERHPSRLTPQPIKSLTLEQPHDPYHQPAPVSLVTRCLRWRGWPLVSLTIAFVGFSTTLLAVTSPWLLWLLYVGYALTLIANHAPMSALNEPHEEVERGDKRGDQQGLIALLWLTLTFLISTVFPEHVMTFAPLSALIISAAWVLSPSRQQLSLLLLLVILELNWTLRYAASLSEALTHVSMYVGSLMVISTLHQKLSRRLNIALPVRYKAQHTSLAPPPSQHSDQLWSLPSTPTPEPNLNAKPKPSESSEGSEGSEPITSPSSQPTSTSTQQSLAQEDHSDQADQSKPLEGESADYPSPSTFDRGELKQVGSSRSGEYDVGLSTQLVKAFEPHNQVKVIQEHLHQQKRRPVKFLDHSFVILLTHLGELMRAGSAVLVWRRYKNGGREGAVRWRWTCRDHSLWWPRYFSMDSGLMSTLLKEDVPTTMRRVEGWDGLLPYYHQDVQVRSLLAVPVCPQGEGRADGILMIDRDHDDPWTPLDIQAVFDLAQKITLDVESSRFMKQLVHDNSLSEALLLGLSEINESQDQASFATALSEALMMHYVCHWVGVCAAQDEVLSLLSTQQHKEAVQKHGVELPITPLFSRVLEGHPMLLEGDEALTSLEELGFHELSKLSKSVLLTPLMDPYQNSLGFVVLGVEHNRLLSPPYINPLNLVISEASVKLSWLYAHERLRQLAMIDGLTQLRNHQTFQVELEQMMKRTKRAGDELVLILLDIDKFKQVNDTYGHLFGDRVIKEVAAALSGSLREVDLVARYGGEEFAIALERSTLEEGYVAAERAREAVQALLFHDAEGAEVRVSISLGVALYPEDSQEQQALIDCADKALYEAKHRGRNQTVLWFNVLNEGSSGVKMCTRHPVSCSGERAKEGEPSSSQERAPLKGIDALITPSRDELRESYEGSRADER